MKLRHTLQLEADDILAAEAVDKDKNMVVATQVFLTIWNIRNWHPWAMRNVLNTTAKNCQAAYIANQAKLPTQPTKDADTKQEQEKEEKVVNKVPTDMMSAVMIPATLAPPGSVIRSILSANSKKKHRPDL